MTEQRINSAEQGGKTGEQGLKSGRWELAESGTGSINPAKREAEMSERSGWQLTGEAVAEAYERYIMAAFGNAWAQALVQVAAAGDGDRMLDVACGTGAVARYAAPLVGPTGHVTG